MNLMFGSGFGIGTMLMGLMIKGEFIVAKKELRVDRDAITLADNTWYQSPYQTRRY